MSFTIYYTSARSVTREEAEGIRQRAQQECLGRSWLSCEPISFFPDLQDGRLIGGSKPSLKCRRADKRAAEDSGLPDGRPRDLLEVVTLIDHIDRGAAGCTPFARASPRCGARGVMVSIWDSGPACG